MLRSILLASLLTAIAVSLSADEAPLLSPRLQRLRSEAASNAGAVADFWNERRVSQLKADPLNPTHYASRSGDSSVAQLPCAMPQPDVQQHDGVPHGKVNEETYAGPSGESHALQIYAPPQTARGAGWLPLVLT